MSRICDDCKKEIAEKGIENAFASCLGEWDVDIEEDENTETE